MSDTIIITVTPMLSVGVTIAASANNVCAGDTVTFTATGTNTGTITNYQWKLGGNVISGATNATYSYVPANNDVLTCVLASNPPCTFSNTATSNAITMTVIAAPVAPTSGTHIPSQTQINWNWNPVAGVTGYKWNTTNNYSTAIEMGTSTNKIEYVLTCATFYTRYVWAYKSCGNSSQVILNQTTSACTGVPCAGTPTVSYGGQTYNTVQIGTQCWLKENLNIGTRINATLEQTNNSVIEKYCYNDLESNCAIYGGLYQWNEMMQYVTTFGVQGICPSGWHIPTDAQWTAVTDFIGGGTAAGWKMKTTGTIEAGTGLWYSFNNTLATNESGFSAVPAGNRTSTGTFYSIGQYTYWWSSTEYDTSYALGRSTNYGDGNVQFILGIKSFGFSVRCLRD
jgi:uncharacterized protein (TIGR02145 family)